MITFLIRGRAAQLVKQLSMSCSVNDLIPGSYWRHAKVVLDRTP